MKTVNILLFSIIFYLNSFSQKEVCIKEKWIAVSNDSANIHLFNGVSEDPNSISVFQEIKNLVDSKKISLYSGNDGWCKTRNGKHISKEIFEEEFWSNGYDSLYGYNPFFEFSIQSDIPLIDKNGDHIIFTDEYGTQMFVYPPPTIQPINLRDLYELQIKEEKIGEIFIPKEISFCIIDSGNITELFWIDIESVKKATQNEAIKYWVQDIQNKNYIGFQFKQTECGEQYKR